MPFWYHLPVPAIDDPQPRSARLVRWLLDEGDRIHPGTRIAIIEVTGTQYAVLANGDGSLREKHFPAGAEIEITTPLAAINTDGENIPYGRPFSLSEPLTAKSEEVPGEQD